MSDWARIGQDAGTEIPEVVLPLLADNMWFECSRFRWYELESASGHILLIGLS